MFRTSLRRLTVAGLGAGGLAAASAMTAMVVLPAHVVAAETGHTVRVVVTGLRSDSGVVLCRLYDPTAKFPDGGSRGTRGVRVKPENRQAVCFYRNVKPGRYAVAVGHDENDNGKIDRSLIGIPKEGYGFSSGARPTILGAPTFERADFRVTADTRISIRIINP